MLNLYYVSIYHVLSYFGSIFDIVIVNTKFMHRIANRLAQYSCGLSGRHCISMVLIRRLHADAPYFPDRVVDRKGDSLVESFVVHLRL
jgi:hypothetical protein